MMHVGLAASLAIATLTPERVDVNHKRVFSLERRVPVVRAGRARKVAFSSGSPAVSVRHRLVLVGTAEGKLKAFEHDTGALRWEVDAHTPFETSAICLQGSFGGGTSPLRNEVFAAGGRDGTLWVLDSLSGDLVWKSRLDGEMRAPPVVKGERVFVATSRNKTYALSTRNGEVLWEQGRSAPTTLTIRGHGRPLLHGDRVFVGYSDGHVAAYDADSGSTLWSRPVSLNRAEFLDVDADPVWSGDAVVFASYSDGLVAVDPDDGATVWSKPIDSPSALGMHDGVLVAASSQGVLWGLAPEDGTTKYRTRYRSRCASRFSEDAGMVALTTGEHGLLLVRLGDGKPMQATRLPSRTCSQPIVTELGLNLLTTRGYLYFFDRS